MIGTLRPYFLFCNQRELTPASFGIVSVQAQLRVSLASCHAARNHAGGDVTRMRVRL
jgi:hypothetical protein